MVSLKFKQNETDYRLFGSSQNVWEAREPGQWDTQQEEGSQRLEHGLRSWGGAVARILETPFQVIPHSSHHSVL